MSRPWLPAPVAAIAAELAGLPGTVAVVPGGSRATATHRPESDWDLGVYYRASERLLHPGDVRRLGHHGQVSELGEWGPLVNGGAWLTIDATPVDVLFRDLDTVEGWLQEARMGRFEVLAQNGYLVGAPTYMLAGELAICRPITGEVPRSSFPEPWRKRPADGGAGVRGSHSCSRRATRVPVTPSAARACSPAPPSAPPTPGSPSAVSG